MRLPVYGLSSLDSRVEGTGNREEVIQINRKREGKEEKEGGEEGFEKEGENKQEKHIERGGKRDVF